MDEPPKSQSRLNFERFAAATQWPEACREFNGLNMVEMLFAYRSLSDKNSFKRNCAASAATINLPRMKYAFSVVDTGEMPSDPPPGDLQKTGQEEDAREFIAPILPKMKDLQFSDLVKAYPQGMPDAVKSFIGGSVDDKNIANTCAIRMSRVLNYSGYSIPAKTHNLYVVAGSDRKEYALRQRELRGWIKHKFGAPSLSLGKGATRRQLWNLQGIIGFDIHWKDANGHIDLWDGATFQLEGEAHEDYFQVATHIDFWRIRGWSG